MLNKIFIIGNVGADPEVRTLQDGIKVATINVATTERFKGKNGEQKESTEWHRIILWQQLAEVAEKWVKKGSQIYVEGKIKTREWVTDKGEKRYATDIIARELKMLGKKPTTSAIDQIASQAQDTSHTVSQADYMPQIDGFPF